MSTQSFFLNVDLEIESEDDLSLLVEAFEPRSYSLERPLGRACFELNEPVSPTDPEPLILEFVRIVKALPAGPREVWNRASRRVFDIGIQSDHHPIQRSYRLASSTLREISNIGADIAITVYAVHSDDPPGNVGER
jgi:hypothetical protein